MDSSLYNFLEQCKDQISSVLANKLKPIFNGVIDEQARSWMKHCLKIGNKKPYPKQFTAIVSILKALASKRAVGLCAEMGCGKTLMAIFSALVQSQLLNRCPRTLIVCPSTLLEVWKREILEICGIGNVAVYCLNDRDAIQVFVNLKESPVEPTVPEFYVVGVNRAKLSYSVERKTKVKRRKRTVEIDGAFTVESYDAHYCIDCGKELEEKKIPKLSGRCMCPDCNSPMWGPADGPRRYAPGAYISKYLKGFFDLLIWDEAHQGKGGSTLQGTILGQLAGACKKTLILTGTLSGGKASDLYYIIQRVFALNYPKKLRDKVLPQYDEVSKFINKYGSLEYVYKDKEEETTSGRSSRTQRCRELPGVSPLLVREFLLENVVFMQLSDIEENLPEKQEEIVTVGLGAYELETPYREFESEIRAAVKKAMENKDYTVMAKMINNLLAWPDFPDVDAYITNKEGHVVVSRPGINLPDGTEKTREMISMLRENKAAGRKTIIYVEYTNKWAGDVRLADVIKKAGLNPVVLKKSVKSEKRIQWIERVMEEGNEDGEYDCLITHPKLVEVGMNLLVFPEVIFFQTGYGVYTIRQASRRSYRPGQTQPVRISYFVTANTFQETAMKLVSKKWVSSLMVEGSFSDGGLSSLAESSEGLIIELARALMDNDNQNDTLDSQFSKYLTLSTDVRSEIVSMESNMVDVISSIEAELAEEAQLVIDTAEIAAPVVEAVGVYNFEELSLVDVEIPVSSPEVATMEASIIESSIEAEGVSACSNEVKTNVIASVEDILMAMSRHAEMSKNEAMDAGDFDSTEVVSAFESEAEIEDEVGQIQLGEMSGNIEEIFEVNESYVDTFVSNQAEVRDSLFDEPSYDASTTSETVDILEMESIDKVEIPVGSTAVLTPIVVVKDVESSTEILVQSEIIESMTVCNKVVKECKELKSRIVATITLFKQAKGFASVKTDVKGAVARIADNVVFLNDKPICTIQDEVLVSNSDDLKVDRLKTIPMVLQWNVIASNF